MYKNEFDNLHRNKKLSNSFVFFGESSYLIDKYIKLVSVVEDASVLSFYYDEYDFNTAKAHLSQASLFGDKNVLIIKSEKKIPKKDLDIFIDFCQKNTNNIFIYGYYGSDYKSYTKAFAKKNTMVVRFFHPKHNEALAIVAEVAKEKNVKIDNYDISHILNIHNNDVALASNEIEKFIAFDGKIGTKEIDSLVFGLAHINIDELIDKILNKKEFVEDLNNILDHGEDEIRIITNLSGYITNLYMFNIYIRVNGSPNALDILGYPAPNFIVEQKAKQSLKFKNEIYYKLHQLLLDAELKMKSSNVDKSAILLSTILRVQSIL